MDELLRIARWHRDSWFEWFDATKKPVMIQVRKVRPPFEDIPTMEGVMTALPGKHFVIKGVHGELYPIEQSIFWETYDTDPVTREALASQ